MPDCSQVSRNDASEHIASACNASITRADHNFSNQILSYCPAKVVNGLETCQHSPHRPDKVKRVSAATVWGALFILDLVVMKKGG